MSGGVSAVAAYAALAGAAVSAYGSYQQGQQSKKLGEYNAQVAERDAQQKESLAIDATRRGQIQEDIQRDKTRQNIASQRVAFAAGGDSLTDQSTQNIFGDTAAVGELDALTIRSNAAREAWGIRNDAANSLTQATSSRMQGDAAARAGTISAIGTTISGASKAYAYKNLKVW